jgi:hypothetical protein
MAWVRTLLAIFLLAHISHSLVLGGRTRPEPDRGEDAEAVFKDFLREVDPPALHSALHSFSPRRYKHGVFEKDSAAAEAVRREDPSLAAGIIVLAKRAAGNTTATITIETTASINVTPSQTGSVTPSPTGSVTPSPVGSVAPPPEGSVAPPPEGSAAPPPTVPVSPDSGPTTTPDGPASTLRPGQVITVTNADGITIASTLPPDPVITTTNADGVAITSTLHPGQAITTTNAEGVTIVSVVDGGVVTLSRAGGSGPDPAAGLSSSEILVTTTLPDGEAVTLTSFTVVQGAVTGIPTPGGSGGGSGSTSPSLQVSLAAKPRTFVREAAGVLAGAVVFAVLM